MSKTMFITERAKIHDTVYVDLKIGAEQVCQFINGHADKDDLRDILSALSKNEVIKSTKTPDEEIREEYAKKLAAKLSLQELENMIREVA